MSLTCNFPISSRSYMLLTFFKCYYLSYLLFNNSGAAGVPSGVYLYTVLTEEGTQTGKFFFIFRSMINSDRITHSGKPNTTRGDAMYVCVYL